MLKKTLLLLSLSTACCSFAHAHVSLDTKQAVAGSYQKISLRVPHGCSGSDTVALRVQVPEGMLSVKPQPKAGWKLSTSQGDYNQSYTLHGATVSSGVKEVTWRGGPLANDHFDEFSLMVYLADNLATDKPLLMPTIQECTQGETRWIDKDQQADSPAPSLRIVSKP